MTSPTAWRQAELGDLVHIERDAVSPEAIACGTLFVGLENISGDDGTITYRTVEAGELGSSKFRFGPTHVLYGKLRPNLRKIGRPTAEGICSTDILPLQPGSGMDRDYLFHYLRSPEMVQLAVARTPTANLPRISPRTLATFPVRYPPLPEQRRIAAILDKADAVRRKRQETLDLADQFLRSAFLDMFGDPVTNPKGWPVRKLGDVGELDRGRSQHRPRNAPELLGGMYPLIQTGDVANSGEVLRGYTQTYSEAGLRQSRMWKAGTLCITIAANIANTAVLAFDACFPDSVVGFAPGSLVTTEYVQGWFTFLQPVLERRAPQVAQKNINLRILRTLDIPIPPIELQTHYAMAVARIRGQRQLLAEHRAGLDGLASALGQRAFRGAL